MPASLREQIQNGFVTRLGTIKTSNGYETNVRNVFADDIPLGINLDDYDFPAILVVGGDVKLKRERNCLYANWEIEVQLFHSYVDDATMHRFVRDVAKAIFADSPTANRTEGFRTIHPEIYEIWLDRIDSDLNMIEANRFFCLYFVVAYKTHIYNL